MQIAAPRVDRAAAHPTSFKFIHFLPTQVKLPFVTDQERIQRSIERLELVQNGADGLFIPKGVVYAKLQRAFQKKKLKAHEWLFLAAPIGMYALLDLLDNRRVEDAMFRYLDTLNRIWSKSFTVNEARELVTACATDLTRLELYLPAWESDINRHMVNHLVETIEELGPPWAWCMFTSERMWHKCSRCRTSRRKAYSAHGGPSRPPQGLSCSSHRVMQPSISHVRLEMS